MPKTEKKNIKIVGISGSLRAQSRNSGLLRCAQEVAPADVTFEIADISDVPFYNADLQARGEKPESVKRLIAQVSAADALMLACPEYNYSLAPALKNALDWLSREPQLAPVSGKAAAILGAGGMMGTSRAQYHLRQVCVYLNLFPLNKPEIFSNASSNCFNEAGDVTDPVLRQRVADQLQALVEYSRKLAC